LVYGLFDQIISRPGPKASTQSSVLREILSKWLSMHFPVTFYACYILEYMNKIMV